MIQMRIVTVTQRKNKQTNFTIREIIKNQLKIAYENETTELLIIPAEIFISGLFDSNNKMKRITRSSNGQLIMCGRVVIQLDQEWNDFKSIGVFWLKQRLPEIKYQFLSLADEEDFEIIKRILKKNPEQIVKFDEQMSPISPFRKDLQHVLYMIHYVDQLNDKATSVIKIDSKTMEIRQIYFSEFQCVHFCLKDFQSKKEAQLEIDEGNLPNKLKDQSLKISVVRKEKNQAIQDNTKLNERHDSLQKQLTQKIPCKHQTLSLVSQGNHEIRVEVIMDKDVLNFGQNLYEIDDCIHLNGDKACLTCYINVMSKDYLLTESEVGWLSSSKLLLTINNEFFLLQTNPAGLREVDNQMLYGIQHLNMKVFVTILKQTHQNIVRKQGMFYQQKKLARDNRSKQEFFQGLIKSQEILKLMDIASFGRYAFISQAKHSKDFDKVILFFTPCEELDGGNIFQQLSSDYESIKPFLDHISPIFIEKMNICVKNMVKYLNSQYSVDEIHQSIDISIENANSKLKNGEFIKTGDKIHMYLDDISGLNAVDVAFQNSAVFCIKAFVEYLITLTEEISLRNCFDKALILMINRGMDVKQLVNNHVFYPQLWKEKMIYCQEAGTKIVPYNEHIESLVAKDPEFVFLDEKAKLKRQEVFQQEFQGKTQRRISFKDKFDESMNKKLKKISDQFKQKGQSSHHSESYEVEFRYIQMSNIEGSNKMSISEALKNSKDLELFEQESIQAIIDYKWDTYSKDFFRNKCFIYLVYIITGYIDIEYDLYQIKNDELIYQTSGFWGRKILCISIQVAFLIYEFIQIFVEGKDYLLDPFNYIELLDPILYFFGTYLNIIANEQYDLNSTNFNDLRKIVHVFTILSMLGKLLNLCKCFHHLSQLVNMIEYVIKDSFYFFVLFSVFLITYAECYNIVKVDTSVYVRFSSIIGELILTLRQATGDNSLIDPVEGFDLYNNATLSHPRVYRHSIYIVYFTFIVWVVAQFFLFMIFMNLIIAVIKDSYIKIHQKQVIYRYLQKVKMIYEKEAHFRQKDFLNPIYFPQVIILRKRKEMKQAEDKEGIDASLASLKSMMSEEIQMNKMLYSLEKQKHKSNFMNSFKSVENQISEIADDVTNISKSVSEIKKALIPKRLSNSSKSEMNEFYIAEHVLIEEFKNFEIEQKIKIENMDFIELSNHTQALQFSQEENEKHMYLNTPKSGSYDNTPKSQLAIPTQFQERKVKIQQSQQNPQFKDSKLISMNSKLHDQLSNASSHHTHGDSRSDEMLQQLLDENQQIKSQLRQLIEMQSLMVNQQTTRQLFDKPIITSEAQVNVNRKGFFSPISYDLQPEQIQLQNDDMSRQLTNYYKSPYAHQRFLINSNPQSPKKREIPDHKHVVYQKMHYRNLSTNKNRGPMISSKNRVFGGPVSSYKSRCVSGIGQRSNQNLIEIKLNEFRNRPRSHIKSQNRAMDLISPISTQGIPIFFKSQLSHSKNASVTSNRPKSNQSSTSNGSNKLILAISPKAMRRGKQVQQKQR